MQKPGCYVPVLTYIALLLLGACEQDLNLDKYKQESIERMLVVNSILNPDSLISVSVTHPYFFSDPHISFSPVPDLNVQMSNNGTVWEALTYNPESGLYCADRKSRSGETWKLRIRGDEQEVLSSDTIPEKVMIESVRASVTGPIHIFWDQDYRFTYRITFQDIPDVENFYFLTIEDDSQNSEYSEMGQVDYTTDPIFQFLAGMINEDIQGWQPDGVFGYPFCDKGIDGEEYSITVNEVLQMPLTWMIEKLPRKIKLYSISKSYFDYMVSVLAMDYNESAFKGNLLALGLMEPGRIYSNITGGAGLMGSYNLSTAHIDLLNLAGGWPN